MNKIFVILLLCFIHTNVALAKSLAYENNLVCEIEGGGTISAHFNHITLGVSSVDSNIVIFNLSENLPLKGYFNVNIQKAYWADKLFIMFHDLDNNKIDLDIDTLMSGEVTGTLRIKSQELNLNCTRNII